MQPEISLEKLMKKFGGKCRGQTTPLASLWTSYNIESGFGSCCNERVQGEEEEEEGTNSDVSEEHIPCDAPSVSARKLGAALWELHHYRNPPRDFKPCKDKSRHPSPISIRLSPRIAPSTNRANTSEELINVLNRIRSLEEQHFTDVSLIIALQKQLAQARMQVEQHETDELRKKIAENKVRKNREQDRVDAAIQLEEERKLRKKSETLCRKLAKGIYEMRKSVSSISTEVEKDRKLINKLSSDIEAFLWTKRNERAKAKISEASISRRTLSDLPMSRDEGPNQVEGAEQMTTAEGNSIETSISHKQDKCEEANENMFKGKYDHKLLMNHFSLTDTRKMRSHKTYRIASSSQRSYSSTVRRWIEKLPSQNPENEVSFKLFPRLKETNSNPKLCKARTRGQQSRSCQKASVFPKRIMHQRRDWSCH